MNSEWVFNYNVIFFKNAFQARLVQLVKSYQHMSLILALDKVL
jgi:hypothetical protein